MVHADLELIDRALRREAAACRELVDRLTPVVQRQVNAALLRRRCGTREDVKDLTQEVFRILLDDDGRALRRWSPEGGATLEGWVGLIAERKVATILESGRKSGYAEQPTERHLLEGRRSPAPSPEATAVSRDELARVLDQLRVTLSDQGYELFVLLFVEQRDVAWLVANRNMSRDAVYAWRSRLGKQAREILEKMRSDSLEPSGRVVHGGAL